MNVWLDRRFWRWSKPPKGDYVWLRYRDYKSRGFGRIYAFVLAVGFDGVGT